MRTLARAFTLLEVLIALAVLAISAIAVVGQSGNSLKQLSLLESKTIAMMLAENALDQLAVSERFPTTGRSNERVSFNGSSWQLDINVSGTTEPWLRKITVDVSQADNPEYALASLTTYRGKY